MEFNDFLSGLTLPPKLMRRLSRSNIAQLEIYIDMLNHWNKSLNLSGAKSREAIVINLIPDSFYLADFLHELESSHFKDNIPDNFLTLDLGAGAGLPGIPLRLSWSTGKYVLIEAREKRALFLANVLARLNIPNTVAYRGRAENFFETAPRAHCIISRAFKPVPELLLFCKGHLYENGLLIIMANSPPPDSFIAINDDWRLVGHYSYGKGKPKWLWALSPNFRQP